MTEYEINIDFLPVLIEILGNEENHITTGVS